MHFPVLISLLMASFAWSSCQDSCRNLECGNGGYCYEGECICPKWYSGKKCDLLFNRNYEGLYEGTYADHERSYPTELFIEADPIPNRLNLPTGVYMEFETDSTLVIPLQSVVDNQDTFLVMGEGSIALEVIDFTYREQQDTEGGHVTSGRAYSFTGTRVEE